MRRLKVSLGPGGSDELTPRHIGQMNAKHTAHIKTKRPYATLTKIKTTGTVLLKKTLPNTHYPYSFRKKIKRK